MENIDLPDATFDAVLCREGLMLVPDPGAERNPWLGRLFDAITARDARPVLAE